MQERVDEFHLLSFLDEGDSVSDSENYVFDKAQHKLEPDIG